MQLTIVHDHLAQRGGAERVALALAQSFPRARFITSVYDPDRTYDEFRGLRVETLWPDRIPFLSADPRRAVFFLRSAFSNLCVDDADVVLCSSSGWAHGIRGSSPRVVYCHNPPRWLYQEEDYCLELPQPIRPLLGAMAPGMRRWDRAAARAARGYISNSRAVETRVRTAYQRDSKVLPPPVTLEPEGPQQPIPGLEAGFYLTVGRPRGYKHSDLVCEAFARRPTLRLVCVGGLAARHGGWPSNVVGLQGVSDAQLRWLYRRCCAVVSLSREDFGLTPIEGFLAGKPALLVRDGGFVDSQRPGLTGEFVPERSSAALGDALDTFDPRRYDAQRICEHGERYRLRYFLASLTAELEAAAHGAMW